MHKTELFKLTQEHTKPDVIIVYLFRKRVLPWTMEGKELITNNTGKSLYGKEYMVMIRKKKFSWKRVDKMEKSEYD